MVNDEVPAGVFLEPSSSAVVVVAHPIGIAGYYGDATMNAVIAIWLVLGMPTPLCVAAAARTKSATERFRRIERKNRERTSGNEARIRKRKNERGTERNKGRKGGRGRDFGQGGKRGECLLVNRRAHQRTKLRQAKAGHVHACLRVTA